VEAVAAKIAKKAAADKASMLDTVREIDDQLKSGAPLPTQNHILIEGFDKYLIIHACFGETVNRTLGGVFDTVLAEEEVISGWWTDGYRILVETPRKLLPQEVKRLPETLFQLNGDDVDKAFTKYVNAKFPFAAKMKFIAERFGVLPRGKTMSYERMSKLRAQFEDTPIYDETLREVMLEKADLKKVKHVMRAVQKGKIKVSVVYRSEKPTPLAYHILTKYADISELMASERVLLSNIDKMRMAVEARTVTLLCMKCGEWTSQEKIKSLPDEPECGNCGSRLLAMLYRNQDLEGLKDALRRRREGGEFSEEELKELSRARRKADLVLSYGKNAVRALEVKGVGPETASRILGKMHPNRDEFYLDLLKAKIQFLRTREFWND
jgi:ATP-dependent Lhr-like helicase